MFSIWYNTNKNLLNVLDRGQHWRRAAVADGTDMARTQRQRMLNIEPALHRPLASDSH